MNTAKFVEELSVTDPDSQGIVELLVFKHLQSGGMFAIDSSYIEQCFDDDKDPVIDDPLNIGQKVILIGMNSLL